MPNFAIIENGKVVNAVIAESDFASTQGWIELPDGVGIEWDYVDGQFVDNRPVVEIVVPPVATKEELLIQLQELQAKIESL